MNNKTLVLGVFSDIHAGSTIGLCHPNGVSLDDGGSYIPSPEQCWLWECWVNGWKHVNNIIERERRFSDNDVDFGIISNGDATDGNHHKTVQILSGAEGAHIKCAAECIREPLNLNPKWVWIIRGTEAHVGKSGGLEEGLAVALDREGAPIQRMPNRGPWSWWDLRLEAHGRLLDFTHHGRMGQRAHTKGSYHQLFAFDVWAERAKRGERAPDIAVRSHMHQYRDSGPPHPLERTTRVIQTPAFQLATAFVKRVSAESLADIGLVAIVIRPTGDIDVSPCIFTPDRGPIWTPDT
jgi:hypothetical protein